jgi:hypothetical protein
LRIAAGKIFWLVGLDNQNALGPLSEMKDHNQGFFDYTNAWAKQHRQAFLAKEIDPVHFDYLDQQVLTAVR